MANITNFKKLTSEEIGKLKERLDEEIAQLNGYSTRRIIRDEDIRVYDFRQPYKFSKQQLSTLTMLFDNFSRKSSNILANITQTNCEVQVFNVEQKPFQEVLKNCNEITALNLISIHPLEGQCILEMPLETVHSIVYRIYGGEEGNTSKIKDLTVIERGVVKRITNKLIAVLKECFENIGDFEMVLDRMETNPQFLTHIPAMEICVSVSLNIQMDHSKGSNMINIILPFLMLESILPKLTNSSVWLSKVNIKNQDVLREKIKQNLEGSLVNFKVEVGKAELTLGDVNALQVGDVLVLNTRTDEKLECIVENRVIAKASAGTYRDKAAVVIEEIDE